MNIAAYCRVSTDKQDQLNSLETQKKFFSEYTQRTGNTLVRLYADEGISGTKIKNRKEFLRMMADAERGVFELVVVKDISRFARNTVDLLQNIRKLKSLGIETQFLTANMTSMGNSEFVLTIFGALAQEESANMSKRVKFGKKVNAEKGKVPNIVFGYDKTKGDLFDLAINEREAEIVREIFRRYCEDEDGAMKIAQMLNARGIKTKRNCAWSPNAVMRILTNEIYTGKVVNGKQEISDFLTGQRKSKDVSEWLITEKESLRIVDQDIFEKAQKIIRARGQTFKLDKTRHSNQYLFSTLIKCKDCGWSFRRVERTYKNTYVTWVCSGRNGHGADSCPNRTVIDEKELIKVISDYFAYLFSHQKNVIDYVTAEFKKVYREKEENVEKEKSVRAELQKLEKMREKCMDLYTDDLISREELNERLLGAKQRKESLEAELKMIESRMTMHERLDGVLKKTFRSIADIADVSQMTNAQLKHIVRRIEVDHDGNVDIFLQLNSELGLENAIPIESEVGEETTVPDLDDCT